MSAIISIPFNHQPVNTGAGSGTYTVPAGKYARLTFNCVAEAYLTLSNSTGLNLTNGNSAESNVSNGTVYLKSGDIISTSTSGASGSYTRTTAGTEPANAVGISQGAILLNGTVFNRVYARVSSMFTAQSSQPTVTANGSASVSYFYEEFTNIS